jgi:hypothetical protein
MAGPRAASSGSPEPTSREGDPLLNGEIERLVEIGRYFFTNGRGQQEQRALRWVEPGEVPARLRLRRGVPALFGLYDQKQTTVPLQIHRERHAPVVDSSRTSRPARHPRSRAGTTSSRSITTNRQASPARAPPPCFAMPELRQRLALIVPARRADLG